MSDNNQDDVTLPQNQDENGFDIQKPITDAFLKQVVALALSGKSQNAISHELKVSRRQVRKVYETEEFKTMVEDVGDDAIRTAKVYIRQEFSKLSKEVVRVLAARLKKDDLEAVKVALKTMGLDQIEAEDGGPQGLTVILGSSSKSKDDVVVVKPEEKKH